MSHICMTGEAFQTASSLNAQDQNNLLDLAEVLRAKGEDGWFSLRSTNVQGLAIIAFLAIDKLDEKSALIEDLALFLH